MLVPGILLHFSDPSQLHLLDVGLCSMVLGLIQAVPRGPRHAIVVVLRRAELHGCYNV